MLPRRAAILIQVLVLVCWMHAGPASAKSSRSKKKASKMYRDRKSECESGPCSHLVPDEAANCVHECASPVCYREVYAAEPLEDGEVDLKKSRLFLDCFKQELRKVSSSQPSDTEFHFADALGFSKSEKDEEDTLDELLAV